VKEIHNNQKLKSQIYFLCNDVLLRCEPKLLSDSKLVCKEIVALVEISIIQDKFGGKTNMNEYNKIMNENKYNKTNMNE